MGRTVRELLASIDSNELTEWMAFERIEPFGGLHDDFRAGAICAAVTNPYVPKDKPSLGASDFMPTLKRFMVDAAPRLPDTPEAHAALLDAVLFGITDG